MWSFFSSVLVALRPAFRRTAAFRWFVMACCGFVLRTDLFGVSSIIRALHLPPISYPALLHFFHSRAWSAADLFDRWCAWLIPTFSKNAESLIFIGDHTYGVKDARRMPEVTTLHQNSETSSKPSFFRGHFWAFLGWWRNSGQKGVLLPLWAEIHRTDSNESRTTRLVSMAILIAAKLDRRVVLILDAFFSVGPVLKLAFASNGQLHILTKAKKSTVAFEPPRLRRRKKPGRPPLYGKKIKVRELFDKPGLLQRTKLELYGQPAQAKYVVVDLFWKPVHTTVRFILIESHYGRLILMTTDLAMNAATAARLYCRRAAIESFFSSLKNLLGGLKYRFWSKYLEPISRRPVRNSGKTRLSSDPAKTANTLEAIEKFVAVQLVCFSALQLLAVTVPQQVCREARCWLRTPCGKIPSPFVVRLALANSLSGIFSSIGKKTIPVEIRDLVRKAA